MFEIYDVFSKLMACGGHGVSGNHVLQHVLEEPGAGPGNVYGQMNTIRVNIVHLTALIAFNLRNVGKIHVLVSIEINHF